MRWDCAPMEGITGAQFRRVHSRCFGGVGRYYAPFLSPTRDHVFTRRELREILPEQNGGTDTVPQLLTKNPEDFLWAAGELAAMGYREVNLNLGCPSGTVTAKGKGAGMLADPAGLERFLDRIFAAPPLAVSVKTRLGMRDPEEFGPLLELFCRYPIRELILHPRVREDFYRRPARREAFAAALPRCTLPVCYNGDLFTAGQCAAFQAEYPGVAGAMLGRGLIGDPALARKASGGPPAGRSELEDFLEQLFDEYARDYGSAHAAMMRMKELWSYLLGLFDGAERPGKALRRARDPAEYRTQAAAILRSAGLRTESRGIF
ncbi:tRNA dihydrouridine synthase [Lawsonibacter celer]|uniref:tRNA dihydrouridine synthase n=1 Tax=Lawsonibacter celer TaxID=2986526 RepID=UPI001646EF10|nr:tRNA-dihydrouridine synthase family protein [Lawsonibacter celer]